MAKQASVDGYPQPQNTYRRPDTPENRAADIVGDYIPWPIFQQEWLQAEEMLVKDGNGNDITIPGYQGLVALGKTSTSSPSATQMNASEIDISAAREMLVGVMKLLPPGHEDRETHVRNFIKHFGLEELPVEYGGTFE